MPDDLSRLSTADLAAELHARHHHVVALRHCTVLSEDREHTERNKGRLDTDPIDPPDGYVYVGTERRYQQETRR